MALTRQQKQALVTQYADMLSSGKDVVLIQQS